MRQTAFLAVSLVVSGVFLWLALRDVPLAEVFEQIRRASLPWLVATFVAILGALWARAIRWRGLLGFKIPLRRAFYIIGITFLLNQLPLRAGEVARSLLATRSGVPVVTAATSIVVERLLDTLLVVVLLALALTRLPNSLPAAQQLALMFGLAAVVAFVLLIVFARYPQVAHRLLETLERRMTFIGRFRLRRLLDQVLAGLEPLTHLRSASHALAWTLVGWSFSLLTFYLLELALNVDGVDLLLMAVMAVTLASFSIAIPVSVAAIGPFEGAVRLAGEAVNMSPALATSLGFLFHGMTILGYAVVGTLGLLALGVSLGDVMRAGDQARPVVEPAASADDVR